MTIKRNAFVTLVAIFLLASCNSGEGKVTNSQQPVFVTRPGSRVTLPTKPSNVALADLNKDGQLDLILAIAEPRAVTVLFGDKAETPFRAATARTFALPESPGEVVLGDVNGDDRLDIALDSHDSYNVTLLTGQADGGFALAPNSPIVMKKGQHPHTHGLGLGT